MGRFDLKRDESLLVLFETVEDRIELSLQIKSAYKLRQMDWINLGHWWTENPNQVPLDIMMMAVLSLIVPTNWYIQKGIGEPSTRI